MSTQARVADSIRSGAMMGADLLQTLVESPVVRTLGTRLPMQRCSCEIPPPCWMPKSLGDVRSRVCAGGTAVLRLRVTNCGASGQSFELEAAGPDAGEVNLQPAKLTLGPMERTVVTATIPLAATASSSEQREALLWVRGCREHYVRWTVTVGGGSDSCHEVDVEDCPDYVHHWYDHFYCEHPCPSSRRG
jgi:hypothetical protein